jgi:hypothetical protein
MNIEDFRLRTSADALRASVLGAARRAVRERRLWRWTWTAAAVVLAVVIPVNRSIDGAPPPRAAAPVPAFDADEGLQLRWRLAGTPRPSPFPREEIP